MSLSLVLATAVAVYVPAPPVPPSTECQVALREYCAEAKMKSSNECRKCVQTHASVFVAKHCSAENEAAYCDAPVPPSGSCAEVLEHYCGADRHNETLCGTCIRDHESELEKAHCSSAVERSFCQGPPKPPAPSAECDKVLTEYCGETRREENRTACAECAVKHRNETEKAHCTYTQIEDFCHPVAPPSDECKKVLFEECAKDRFNRTACKKCEEEHAEAIKEAKCTTEQEAEFCEPPRPPTPPPHGNGTCLRALETICGKEHHNRTSCVHCVQEHEATFKADGCTYKDIDAFCDIRPPPVTCPGVLEEYCGADRHNASACKRCVERHENQTSRAHCTQKEEEEFCATQPPSDTCPVELEHYCGIDRRNATLCATCVRDHKSELEKAHCTEEAEHVFCEGPPKPPAPSAECDTVLTKYCGETRRENNRTACTMCVARHHNETEKAHCSYTQLEDFCHVAPPPSTTCLHVLFEDCGETRTNHSKCLECEKTHEAAIKAAKCTEAQVADFCEAPKPPPTPSGKCFTGLTKYCENERSNRTGCLRCAEEHHSVLEGDNCTYREIDYFCHVTPPTPSDDCRKVEEHYCDIDRHNRTLCEKCLARHANETAKAHCTTEEKMEFCNTSPTPAPVSQCTRVLESDCGLDRHDHSKCLQCTADHEAAEKAAHCTVEEVTAFCRVAPPSPPSPPANKCTIGLKADCGMSIDKHACIECTVTHAAALKADGCTETEINAFCDKSASSWFF